MKRGQPYDHERKKKEGYDSAMSKFNAWRTSCGFTNDMEPAESEIIYRFLWVFI
jgi:hypothetical protein